MKIRNILLGIIIAIIFLMFCIYGIKLFYNAPDYNDFCNNTYTPNKFPVNCTPSLELQEKQEKCYIDGGISIYEYNGEGCEIDLTCDFCNKDFIKAEEEYTKNLFILSLFFSLIIIIISVIVIKVLAVSNGLILGSLFFIIYGTSGYWRFMDDLLRFGLLGIVLLALIWLSYYISKKGKRKKFKLFFSKKRK